MDGGLKHVTLTRELLYDQVGATPMSRLAPKYGLSDVGLKKACTRHKILTPPPGYWAKKANGKRVVRTPLPAAGGDPSPLISLLHDPYPRPRARQPASCPVTDPELVALFLSEGEIRDRSSCRITSGFAIRSSGGLATPRRRTAAGHA